MGKPTIVLEDLVRVRSSLGGDCALCSDPIAVGEKVISVGGRVQLGRWIRVAVEAREIHAGCVEEALKFLGLQLAKAKETRCACSTPS